jgi:hypothetical protein
MDPAKDLEHALSGVQNHGSSTASPRSIVESSPRMLTVIMAAQRVEVYRTYSLPCCPGVSLLAAPTLRHVVSV